MSNVRSGSNGLNEELGKCGGKMMTLMVRMKCMYMCSVRYSYHYKWNTFLC